MEEVTAKTGTARQRADDADKNIVNATNTNNGRTDCKDNAQEKNSNPAVVTKNLDAPVHLREDGSGTDGNFKPAKGMPVSVLCDGTYTGDDGGNDIETSQNNDEQNGVTNVDNESTSAVDNIKSLENQNAKNGHDAVNKGSVNKAGK